METSYFFGYWNQPNAVSIAGKSPKGFTGRQYKQLAPKYSWWKEWHDGKITNDDYVNLYYETVLDCLDPQTVYNELGENAVLLCWEVCKPEFVVKPFCHRFMVADWFANTLGILVKEKVIISDI